MKAVRSLLVRLAGSFGIQAGPDATDEDIRSELESHVRLETAEYVRRGLSPEEARRRALLSAGGMTSAAESVRQQYQYVWLEQLTADMRYALRGLRRSPTFAATAILVMALGIGASTAIFSVTDAVLLRPLPIPNPGDFTYLGWRWAKGDEIPALTAFQYEFVRDHGRAFDAVASYNAEEALIGDESPAVVRGLRVTSGFFSAIGFTPRLGRAFDAEELANAAPVIILGDAVWRGRFGEDPRIIGRRVALDGVPRTVVGVMPREFRFPPAVENDAYLVPFVVRANPHDEGHNSDAIARWRHGTSAEARNVEIETLTRTFRAAYPDLAAPTEAFSVFSHRDVHVASVKRTIWLLFGAVSLLLLIACANTATLMLVRSSARQREMAVRTAIGAGPGRILRQLLTEGVVLSVIATAAGVAIGVTALNSLLAVAPNMLPAGMRPEIDLRVFAYVGIIAAATAIIFGLATGLPSFKRRLSAIGSSRNVTAGGTRVREALIFIETSAAVVLLAGATLLAASFSRLMRVDAGFDVDGIVTMKLGRLPSDYDASRRDQMVDRLLERIRETPGVESAALAPNLPLERGRNFSVDTRERPDLGIGAAEIRFVSTDYFATLGIRLVAGRDFDLSDVEGREPVAIVNETLARRFWGDSSAIGRTIQIGHFKDRWANPASAHQTRIIGVSADVHEIGLDRPARPTVVLHRGQARNGLPVFLIRTSSVSPAPLRRIVADLDSRLTPVIEPLSSTLSKSVAAPRFRMLLLGSFAASALLVAAIGIYGVISSLVQMRTRELGIRLALGASRGSVALAVARRCLTSVSAGAVAGLLIYWGAHRLLASMLYDTSAADPLPLSLAIAILALVAALAAWIPARRATRIDPVVALRTD
jgi:predicted permease